MGGRDSTCAWVEQYPCAGVHGMGVIVALYGCTCMGVGVHPKGSLVFVAVRTPLKV